MSRILTEAEWRAHQARYGRHPGVLCEEDVTEWERRAGRQGKSGMGAGTTLQARGPKTPARAGKRPVSALEEAMAAQLQAAGINMVRQHKPIPGRRYRLDFAIPDRKIALECDGMVHRIKGRYVLDIQRHNVLTLAGWRWIRGGRIEIHTGRALADLLALIG